jgi:hypothetical protein
LKRGELLDARALGIVNRNQQLFLVCLIVVSISLLVGIPFVVCIKSTHITVAKLVGSAGLFLDIAGIIQLELSGAFERLVDEYGNVEKYPGGPPSRITRQIIDDPDAPFRTALRNFLFFEHRAGIWLLVAGFVLQLSSVWIWV